MAKEPLPVPTDDLLGILRGARCACDQAAFGLGCLSGLPTMRNDENARKLVAEALAGMGGLAASLGVLILFFETHRFEIREE